MTLFPFAGSTISGALSFGTSSTSMVCGACLATALTGAFFAAAFFAVAFLAGAFLAGAFLAGVFLAGAFEEVFLVGFFAGVSIG